MNVSSNLLEYLKKNDSAELIGIGTFRVQYTSASISPITNTLTPPCRSVIFTNDTNNDLGFAEDMAKKEFISLETAIKWISQYSDSLKERIELTGSCKMGDLGTISKGQNNKLIFSPIEGLNLLDSAFAFSTIKSVKTFNQGDYIKPIVTKEPIKEEIPFEEKKPIEKEIIEINVKSQSKEILAGEEIKEAAERWEKEVNEVEELEEKVEILSVKEQETKEIVFNQSATEDNPEINQEVNDECYDKSDCSNLNYKNSEEFLKKEKKRNKKEKRQRKERRKRNRIIWAVLFSIILLGLLAFGSLVLAHYMCWIKGNKQLKPITNKLSVYITPKCNKTESKTITVPVSSPTIEIVPQVETSTETVVEEKVVEENKTKAIKQKPLTKKTTPKEEVLKPTGEKDNPPTPTAEIDYSTPILIQPVSRLGFDVVGGTYENLSNAQQTARKARSLGYDSYIITKKADEKTKYYVSYGSRRTMREANTFLTNIGQKHGSAGFYIISR